MQYHQRYCSHWCRPACHACRTPSVAHYPQLLSARPNERMTWDYESEARRVARQAWRRVRQAGGVTAGRTVGCAPCAGPFCPARQSEAVQVAMPLDELVGFAAQHLNLPCGSLPRVLLFVHVHSVACAGSTCKVQVSVWTGFCGWTDIKHQKGRKSNTECLQGTSADTSVKAQQARWLEQQTGTSYLARRHSERCTGSRVKPFSWALLPPTPTGAAGPLL